MNYCKYGCGQEAKYQLKNGAWCCSEYCGQCPELKRKNSKGNKGKKLSKEASSNISKSKMGNKNPMFGREQSKYHKSKIGKAVYKGVNEYVLYFENASYWAKELKKVNKECCLCKSKIRLEMHHKDKNIKNNKRFNLIILCRDCHAFWHCKS